MNKLDIVVPRVNGRLDYIVLFNVPELHGYSVYEIEHMESGRKYIYTAQNVEARFKRYERHVRNGNPESFITGLMITFGIENFMFKVVASGFKYQSDAKEYAQTLLDELPRLESDPDRPDAFNRYKAIC